jgi:uncharacterized protein (TIGR03435 family)
MMLQTLLEDRFHLVLRREMKEMSVFALTLGPNGPKTTLSQEGKPWIGQDTGAPLQFAPGFKGVATEALKPGVLIVAGRDASMQNLAVALQGLTGTGRPVLDKTDLAGEFSFDIAGFASFIYNYNGAPSPQSIFAALEEQLGLKLQATTAAVEVLVVDRAERPSEN